MLIRGSFALLALLFTGVGLAGAILPGLPTVPFLLVAVACGRRGWPDLAARLESHPRWGRTLVGWRRHRAVPRRAKWLAGTMMAAGWASLALAGAEPRALALLALLLCAVLAWLCTRPDAAEGSPPADSGVRDNQLNPAGHTEGIDHAILPKRL